MECELDHTYVSAVERSHWNISLSNIERLANALGIALWELIKPLGNDEWCKESTAHLKRGKILIANPVMF